MPYYTNSSHLPVSYTEDLFSALDIQDELQTFYTSGTVFHAYIGEKMPDWQSAAALVRKIAENYKLPYYTISPTYSVCADHGYIAGEHFSCPTCGRDAEVYSRITGYYRPVQNWNAGKTQEYKDRTEYDLENSKLTHEGPLKPVTSEAEAKSDGGGDEAKNKPLLFTTSTCPNCRIAISMLDKKNFDYEVVDAGENAELAKTYGIRLAPTLIVGSGEDLEKIVGAGAIKQYVS